MDTNDTEMSTMQSANTEEKNHQEVESMDLTTSESVAVEINESKNEENSEMEKEKSGTQKETIEILKIELVAPRRVDPQIFENESVEIEIPQNEGKLQLTENNVETIGREDSIAITGNTDKKESSIEKNMEPCVIETPQNEEKLQLPENNNESIVEEENYLPIAGNADKKESIYNIPENVESCVIETNDENALTCKIKDTYNDPIANTLKPMVPTSSGLSLLAQYDSDNDDDDEMSDTDSIIEVPSASTQDYRNQVVEINSDSDSDDSDSGVEYLNELRETIKKRTEVAVEDDEEDEDDDNEDNVGKKKRKPKLKVKGEMLLEDLPPIQDLQITVAEDECIELGKIHSIVDQLVLVTVLPNSILLDLETVIFLEKGQKVLGEVFDVLGQVADPMYCVRFNSNKHVKEKQINVGDVVYVAPKTQYTQYVILSNLMKLRGSDASWENDIEPPPRFLDYSDDEQEQLARRQLRNRDRPVDNDDPHKRPRTREEENFSENSSTSRGNYTQHRNRNSYRDPAQFNSNARPRYNAPHQNQQRPSNYHRSSWHSNYYPQPFPPQTSTNYAVPPHNRSQPTQAYPTHIPMYGMPPPHNMPYPPPHILQHQPPHLMTNSYSIRPPTLQGPHTFPGQQQYTSPPPPPPGQ